MWPGLRSRRVFGHSRVSPAEQSFCTSRDTCCTSPPSPLCGAQKYFSQNRQGADQMETNSRLITIFRQMSERMRSISTKTFLASSRKLNKYIWSDLLTFNHLLWFLPFLCLFQNRRWSSAQAREFLHLHSTLALITLHSDLTPQQTHGATRIQIFCDSIDLGVSTFRRFSLFHEQHRVDSNYR